MSVITLCRGSASGRNQRRQRGCLVGAAVASVATLLACASSSAFNALPKSRQPPSHSPSAALPQEEVEEPQQQVSSSIARSRRDALMPVAAAASSPLWLPSPEAVASTGRDRQAAAIFQRASPCVLGITQGSAVDRRQSDKIQTTGSGFVWDKEHVITNFHVVAAINQMPVVVFRERDTSGATSHRLIAATLVGADPLSDLAVLRVDGELVDGDVPPEQVKPIETLMRPLKRGSSADLLVGQDVYALGTPFGLEQSMSRGIISGLARKIEGTAGRPISGVIQTDASINPGNSGGPLLDSDGQVIGMNTAILSTSGTFAGVGLAIPIDTVEKNVASMIEKGFVTRPSLGVIFAPDRMLEPFGIENGAMVLKVVAGGPAFQAGLLPMRRGLLGDVIVGCEGRKIRSTRDIFEVLDQKAPGDELVVRVQRASVDESRDGYDYLDATIRLAASTPKLVIT